MELATALIWTLRIVLPIILFCIYFRLQTPKDEQHASGPTSHGYSRGELMAHRKAIKPDCPIPTGLVDITLKDQTEAPALFVSAVQRGSRGAPRRERAGEVGRGERRERRGDG